MNILHIFRRPSPFSLAAAELEDARRSLLNASSAYEYAEAMVQYHEARIKRLGSIVAQLANEARIEQLQHPNKESL